MTLLIILLGCWLPALVAFWSTGQVWPVALAYPMTYALIRVNTRRK